MKKSTLVFIFILACLLCSCMVPEVVPGQTTPRDAETVDFRDDYFTQMEQDGIEVRRSSGAWPKNDVTAEIPEPADGVITAVLETDTCVCVTLEELTFDSFDAYMQSVMDAGYTVGMTKSVTESGIVFRGTKENGYYVILQYETETQKGSIQLELAAG